ncbi:MAG: four-carbon acid sugar kinase family protein [Desulfatiglandaceae bacterium]
MSAKRISRDTALSSLPSEWPEDVLPDIQDQARKGVAKVVVLDDDPTGTQTVQDIPVLTHWSLEALIGELRDRSPAFFLLTNSRSVPLEDARAINFEIGRNLKEASRVTGQKMVVISRSDSTLRGHFPGEVEALSEGLGERFDAWLMIPFFMEGGRYTIDDIHYVSEGDSLVPAGQTEFARDPAFGYKASNLREWVEEKTSGRILSKAVASVSIADIRRGGPERVAALLSDLKKCSVCIVNAASYRDLETFTKGLLLAEAFGKRFLYRTAASFVRVRAGMHPKPLLTGSDLGLSKSGGALIVVGSYVPRTTSQLNALRKQNRVVWVEVDVKALLDDNRRSKAVKDAVERTNRALHQEHHTVVFTTRKVTCGKEIETNLSIGEKISEGLVSIVKGVSTRPRYVLAKGGITSSVIATRGLGVKRARVLGQVVPGVPVWQLGPESRHPGLIYIVFPGNVGELQALVEVVKKMGPDL